MPLVVTATLIVVVLGLLYFVARRDITLCELSITKKSGLVVVRGGIAPAVLSDLRDVVRRARLKSGTVRILRAKDRARIEASREVSADALQAIRNVVGTVSLAKLAAGKNKR